MSDDSPFITIGLLGCSLALLFINPLAGKSVAKPRDIPVKSYVYLQAKAPPPKAEDKTYRALANEDPFKGLEHKNLIECIAWEESRWDAKARGDQGESWGAMQYWRSWRKDSFWGIECVPRGYRDPFNFHEATECADEILQEDFSKVCHWSTAEKCGINCK